MVNLTPHPAFASSVALLHRPNQLSGMGVLLGGWTEDAALGCRRHHGGAADGRECSPLDSLPPGRRACLPPTPGACSARGDGSLRPSGPRWTGGTGRTTRATAPGTKE